jgi:predicted transcriptional regulator
MRTKDRRKAIILRREGKTYSEIRKTLHIPKSTLSDWLKGYLLNPNELKRLKKNIRHSRDIATEKIRETKQRKKDIRIMKILKEEKQKLLPLNLRELYIAGLLLYLGEGNKGDNSTVSLNNTDPSVVKLYCFWLTQALHIQQIRLRVALHLYKDMDINQSIKYWSNYLAIPKEQFLKPYIKDSNRKDIDQKGFGHGTCGIYIYDRVIKLRVLAGMNAITGMI